MMQKRRTIKKMLLFILCSIMAILVSGFSWHQEDFSKNTEIWLINQGMNIVENGVKNISINAVGYFTSSDDVKENANTCIDQAENGSLQKIICIYADDTGNTGTLSMARQQYINSFGGTVIAENLIIMKLWDLYCSPMKVPKDMPSSADIILGYDKATWIVSFQTNDQNILTEKVSAVPFTWDENRYLDNLDESLLKRLTWDSYSYDEFLSFGNVESPDFLQEKEKPDDMEFFKWCANDVALDIIKNCKEAQENNLPESILPYAGTWSNVRTGEYDEIKIWNKIKSSLESEIVQGSPEELEDYIEKRILKVIPEIYMEKSFDGTLLAFSASFAVEKSYVKPDDFLGSCVMLVKYSLSEGMLVTFVEEAEYVSVYVYPIICEDFSLLESFMDNIFENSKILE